MIFRAVLIVIIATVFCSYGYCEDGIIITSKITTDPVSSVITKTVTFNSRFMKISKNKDKYTLIDKPEAVAYVVNLKEMKAHKYLRYKHNYFFNRFLVAYGIMNENGDMIYSETIFKNIKQHNPDNNQLVKVSLPGNFLGMRASLWFNNTENEISALFKNYLSFFSDNPSLLKQAAELDRFPVKTEVHLTINGNSFSKVEETISIKSSTISDSEFLLPENLEIKEPETF